MLIKLMLIEFNLCKYIFNILIFMQTRKVLKIKEL